MMIICYFLSGFFSSMHEGIKLFSVRFFLLCPIFFLSGIEILKYFLSDIFLPEMKMIRYFLSKFFSSSRNRDFNPKSAKQNL